MSYKPARTRQNTITKVIGTTPLEILSPNPSRKAFLLTPIAGGPGSDQAILAQVFNAGVNQLWTVPVNVTSVIDAYCWGAGGKSGAAGAALGGGGGGGGGFARTGPQTVIPGSNWTITVVNGTAGGTSSIKNASLTTLAASSSGDPGVLDAAGNGGTALAGLDGQNGGNGFAATGLGGDGGGGGGGSGSFAAGSNGANSTGGAGGGSSTILTYGAGGAGGDGGTGVALGNAGVSPGGGGGGSSKNGGASIPGADGLVVIVYAMPLASQAISLSPRSDVAAGLGVLNYLPEQSLPTVIHDSDIGDAIGLPWWIVSGVGNVTVQIVEYSYDE